MKRLLITLVFVLGIVAVAVAGSAYWAGFQAEKQYRAFLQQQASINPNVKLAETTYQRGWFSSQAVTQVGVKSAEMGPAAEGLSFSLKHDIYHGVVPIGWWLHRGFSPQPVQVVVHTSLAQDNPSIKQITDFFGREPLAIDSTVALDGSSQHAITVPPLNLSNQAGLSNLAFSGLSGQFHAAPNGATVKGEMHSDALLVEGAEQPHNSIKLRDLKVTVDQRLGQIGLMLGDSSLRLDTFEMKNLSEAVQSLAISGLSMLTKVKETAGQNDLLDSGLNLAVDKVTWDGTDAGKGTLNLAMNKLDGAVLLKIRQWSERQGNSPDPTAFNEILTLFQALLKRNPELALDTLINTSQGDLQANALFIFQNPSQLNPQDLNSFLQLLANAKADITVAKELLENALTTSFKSQLREAATAQGQQPDEATLHNVATAQVQQQLAQLVEDKWLRLEGNNYRTQARVEEGKLFVNDNEIKL